MEVFKVHLNTIRLSSGGKNKKQCLAFVQPRIDLLQHLKYKTPLITSVIRFDLTGNS